MLCREKKTHGDHNFSVLPYGRDLKRKCTPLIECVSLDTDDAVWLAVQSWEVDSKEIAWTAATTTRTTSAANVNGDPMVLTLICNECIS
jgi:hypothetical protein